MLNCLTLCPESETCNGRTFISNEKNHQVQVPKLLQSTKKDPKTKKNHFFLQVVATVRGPATVVG